MIYVLQSALLKILMEKGVNPDYRGVIPDLFMAYFLNFFKLMCFQIVKQNVIIDRNI